MPGCCASGCTNRPEKGFIMKVFPRDPVRRKQWATMVKREGWFPTEASRLCEAHFEPHMWEKVREDGKRSLRWNAVPTIFSHREPTKRRKPTITRKPCSPKEMKHVRNEENTCSNLPDTAVTGAKGTSKMEEVVTIKSEPVWPQENSSLKVQLKGEYEPEPHIWVKEEVWLKEEVQDRVSEKTEEEQPSHSERNPFTAEELEIVTKKVEDSCEFNNLESDLFLKEDKALPEGVELEPPDNEECSQDDAFEHSDCVSKRSHDKTISYRCDMCLKAFRYSGNLVRHKLNVHEYRKIFPCSQCNKSFARRQSLQQHVEINHVDERKLPCPQCSKSFTRKASFKEHLLHEHGVQITFPCPQCSKSFTRRQSLIEHKLEHGIHTIRRKLNHGNHTKFHCPQCSNVYKHHYNLKRHLDAHSRDRV